MKNTNDIDACINDNDNDNDNEDIDIKKLLYELEIIGNEKEKKEFIKNYSKIKEQIKITDDTLDENNLKNMSEYESKTIIELFQFLEQNENKILYDEKLTLNELKSLIIISKVLDEKINNDTMSIIEIN